MPTVGYATLQIVPSIRGISDELRRQLVGPAADAGGEAGQAAGGGLKDKLKLGAAAAGAAAGALLVAGIGEAMEQANITSSLQAQLGTSNKVAAAQGKVAGELYSSGVAGSFQEAADAIKSVVQSGLAPPDATNAQLQQIATKASDLANVFGQDLGGVTNAVSQMLRTGLAKNADQAFDLITTGFQSGADKAGDLLDTVNEYGTQFRKAGLDGASAIGLINQAIKGGARDADLAADAIKEFSIRAVDGSKSSADGFKALGLNADDMAAKFAKGGSAANGVLDVTLDKLRGIKDPVKQSQIAVQLFGTQAEDLGKALFAMDPSSAAKGLGQVGGAADKVGKTIRSGPAHEIEVFTRTLKQGFVDFLGGQLLPVVSTVAHVMNDNLVPAFQAVTSVVSAVINWFREWGIWLTPMAIAVGGLTLALNAQAIATGFVTAVFSAYRAAILVGTAVTNGFAAAQALLNAVMAINPFVLIAIAVVALGAALVIAWKRSETFRSIVMAAWQGIQTAAKWAWNSVLKPTIDGLVTGWKYVADGALWLWNTVLKPVFGFISTAARIVATIYGVVFLVAFKVWWTGVKLYAGLVMGVLRGVGDVAVWLWRNAIQPVIGWIVGAFKLWWTGVKLYAGLVMTILRTVGGWVRWLYFVAVKPVFDLILAAVRLTWAGVKVVFGYFVAGLKVLGGWAKWLWVSAISPAMNGIKNVISAVWNSSVKLTFNAMKAATGQLGRAFEAAKNAIKLAWDKVKGIARAPVQFIVDTVYNKGIVGVWNKVAGAFGAPKLGAYKFATGGPVFGAGTETSDDVPAWLSKNEHVWTAKEVRGAGGHGAVMSLRKWAAAGGTGPLPAFKDGGGLFGWIGKAGSALKGVGSDAWEVIKKGTKWLKDTLGSSARAGVKAVVNPLLSRMPGLGSGFGKMIRQIPNKMINTLFGYADAADKKGAAASGLGGGKIPAGRHLAIINAALRAAGVPPPGTLGQWQAGLNTLITRESGWNASAINRWDSNAKAGHPSQGLAQTIPGTWSAYVPSSLRSRGILDPVGNVAAAIRYIVSRYGNITRVQQANASRPPAGYDSGGWLRPGVTTAVNATGQPEAVLTAGQWRVASNAMAAAGRPIVVEVHTRDEALAGFIDVRIQGNEQALLQVIEAS
ncbi:phage tail tape measure protein [Streptomyces sp. NPDC101166]|uniref:phage tail tape measure protein n=1 Tax=Streptomyces sp. NPDC101166 TaxID=3366120 RepID=UPI00382C22C7